MKKLFLIIPLLTISIYVSAATDATHTITDPCKPPLLPPPLQLTGYIYWIINSPNKGEVQKLRDLLELIGVKVKGWHRAYFQGKKKYTQVAGVIQDINIIEVDEPGTAIYEMTLSSEESGSQKFRFSGTYSPFLSLETTSLFSTSPLAANIISIGNPIPFFRLLAVGLDTPSEVADYKNTLSSQEVVVLNFDARRSYRSYHYYKLSRSYARPIVIREEIWPSVIHYFEAQKFANSNGFYNKHVFDIRSATSQEEAIRIARDRSHLIRSDWEEVKNKIMFDALVAKFTQHKDLYDLLISTRDAPILEHSEDPYWGDGEDGTGRSMLGNLLTEVRGQLERGLVPEYGLPQTAGHPQAALIAPQPSLEERLSQLRIELEGLDPQNSSGVHTLLDQIASSNMSIVEKVDRMQMILYSKHFFERKARGNQTSTSEWLAFIEEKYSEDVAFKYQLIQIGVFLAGPRVVITSLNHENLPNHQKINIYQIIARQSPNNFVQTLHYLSLSSSDIRGLYLYALQFEASLVYHIRKLPRNIVNDSFIQDVINTLNEHRFTTQDPSLLREPPLQRRRTITQELIAAAASHGLNYKSNKPLDTPPSQQDRMQDPVQLVLISDNTYL